MKRLSLVFFVLFLACHQVGASSLHTLGSEFYQPPDSARPWVYWFVMDGNFTREGITADMEAMKRAGIGGVIFMEVNVGIPRGPVQFMSPEWRQLFKHAVAEAERLGLQITLNAGPGWTGSGGPWVKPEQSMQHIVASEVELTGPTNFSAVLPHPSPRPPYFGKAGLPPSLLKTIDEFYADVAVLAVPKTSPSNRIADIEEKALYLRHPYSSRPGTKPFLPAPATFTSVPGETVIPADRVLDLSQKLQPDGRLDWEAPPGQWVILRFGRTSTGANTRPAPEPGMGLESDKFDQAALDAHFEAYIGTLLRDIGKRKLSATSGWNMLHIDSWEMGAQNWTAGFRSEFRRRRGYDPLSYLPALTDRIVESREISERFLWDLRQTAQELTIENHASHLKELGHRHGFGLSIEPYDMNPCSDMSLGGVADVPMCEFWLRGFDTSFSVIEAASIAHTCGRPIVAAESFTSDDSERWLAHPASMKTLGDWAFCSGVNRIVFHRYQHQPRLDQWPGMTMGPYGVHWERTQTWWEMASAYHQYLARCQHMLRQGLPVADICYLVAEGAPHVFRPPASATRGNPPERLGYNFDGIAPDAFQSRMSLKNGKLTLPDGMSYRVLVLPERQTMTPGLLRKVKQLVDAGATVIGPRPLKSPSLSGYPQCDEDVKRLADEMWGADASATANPVAGTSLIQHVLGRGRLIWEPGAAPLAGNSEQYGDFKIVAEVLSQMGVAPDFESDGPVRYIHRHHENADIYFVANRDDRAIEAACSFRVSGKSPWLWDPLSGMTRALPRFEEKNGRTIVPLHFEAAQSFFVVFARGGAKPARDAANFAPTRLMTEIAGPWEVAFDPKRGGPEKPARFERLQDWSTRPEPGIRYYSGTATYRTAFAFAEPTKDKPGAHAARTFLDLGMVKNLARVRLNGRELGVIWCAPWRVDITEALRPGQNELEITVANLWPNRLIGDQGLPQEQRFTATTWNPFKKGDPLLASGLLGPVTLHWAPAETEP